MAMLDAELLFSSGQVVSASAASTNVVDFKAANNMGAGSVPKVLLCCTAVSGTPTITPKVETDNDEAFGSPTTVVTGPAIATPVAGTLYRLALPSSIKEQYMRLYYTLSSTTSATYTAALIIDEQTTPMTGGT